MERRQQQHTLTPLEKLPVTLFYEICKYLLVVDYDDRNFLQRADRPFLCRVRLNRGYALAVCSKRCNELFEDTARIFLTAHTPSTYFVPPLASSVFEASPSYLSRFYTVKGMEVRFRFESRCLIDMLQKSYMDQNFMCVNLEKRLLHQVNSVVEGPIVRNFAEDVLRSACVVACQRGLRCVGSLPNRTINPDPEVAKAFVSVLAKIVEVLKLLDKPMVDDFTRTDPLSLLYLANLKSSQPNLQKAEDALLHILSELNETSASSGLKYTTHFQQSVRLNAYRELFHLYLSTKRNNDAFTLLSDGRAVTKILDPVNIWTLTQLVAKYAKKLGLERALLFVKESAEYLNSILSPQTEFQWLNNVYEASKWYKYKHDCNILLRSLREQDQRQDRRRRNGLMEEQMH